MIAIVRIMMKDVNIVASTALQAIDDMGRSEAIMAGANMVMPNITPGLYRNDYNLYENKPWLISWMATPWACWKNGFTKPATPSDTENTEIKALL